MITSKLSLDSGDISTKLVPLLRGRVFHLTCHAYLSSILIAGRINVNSDGARPTAFGSSENSFFRLRDCVSVFDYRSVTDEELDTSLTKCSPYQACGPCGYELAIFFLGKEACDRLASWNRWKIESSRQMVVPYVEAGHPGDILLADVDELWQVSLHYEPSPLVKALQAARRKRVPR